LLRNTRKSTVELKRGKSDDVLVRVKIEAGQETNVELVGSVRVVEGEMYEQERLLAFSHPS
jgi:hypothetical protein